ncbi:DMT family transporter [Flavimaricola marinus]|uniref:EamA-like transporter family protein n=1 Tax=Flavimaricola marinus TaxID=1819565 RepID=A0A238L8A8_9RHOB|nr:DMT family transporter [Flavimaricola marinus]SMY05937.1 EamA-like transporter family protein [Flavimaricola marinus]
MKLFALTTLTMIAFAANSLLNRLGVAVYGTDPGLFAVLRVAAGAVVLWVLVWRRGAKANGGLSASWTRRIGAASMLALYMAGFSAAYLTLDAGVGALILFGGVQVTMFAGAVAGGERLTGPKLLGAAVALSGLGVLVWPTEAVSLPVQGVTLMSLAAVGWGVYSLMGRAESDPLAGTAANFALCLPIVLPLILLGSGQWTWAGAATAAVAGGLTSGLGYALWYQVLPKLAATRAAIAQLSVPVIAAAGGVLVLGESIDWRFAVAAALVLGGIGLSLWKRR